MIILKLVTATIEAARMISSEPFKIITYSYVIIRYITVIDSIKLFILSIHGVFDSKYWEKTTDYPELWHGNIFGMKKRLPYVCYFLIALGVVVNTVLPGLTLGLPGCPYENSTWIYQIADCHIPYVLYISAGLRMFQTAVVVIYIYINAATFTALFERLFLKMKSDPLLTNSPVKIFEYRKHYGYLSQCVSAFNDKLGFNIAMSLISLVLQVLVISIYLKDVAMQTYIPLIIYASLGFALLMYGSIHLAEIVSTLEMSGITWKI